MAEFEPLSVNWAETELYEKQRIKKIRKRIRIVFLCALVFFSLSSIQIVEQRAPAWVTYYQARVMSDFLEQAKLESIQSRQSLAVIWDMDQQEWKSLPVDSCVDYMNEYGKKNSMPATSTEGVVPSDVMKKIYSFEFPLRFLKPSQALELGMDRTLDVLQQPLCHDPLAGFYGTDKHVIGIFPDNDLTMSRLDRASYIVIDAESAKITFY